MSRHVEGGKREDLGGRYFRSTWEANYARYLNFLLDHGDLLGWEYEPKTFRFPGIERGAFEYRPDFLVKKQTGAEWHEVKGWMDPKSKTRLKRMAKYFPAEKVVVIDATWFRRANDQLAALIPGWERGRKPAPSNARANLKPSPSFINHRPRGAQ